MVEISTRLWTFNLRWDFALTSGFGLLPTYAQAILGGWVFGVTMGTAAAMCGLLGGAAIGFFFARIISGSSIKAFIDRNPRGRVIRSALVESSQRRTFLLILLLRLPPNSPFAIANLAMGASGVRAMPLLGGTALGMFPRTLVTCGAAAAAAATGAKIFSNCLLKLDGDGSQQDLSVSLLHCSSFGRFRFARSRVQD